MQIDIIRVLLVVLLLFIAAPAVARTINFDGDMDSGATALPLQTPGAAIDTYTIGKIANEVGTFDMRSRAQVMFDLTPGLADPSVCPDYESEGVIFGAAVPGRVVLVWDDGIDAIVWMNEPPTIPLADPEDPTSGSGSRTVGCIYSNPEYIGSVANLVPNGTGKYSCLDGVGSGELHLDTTGPKPPGTQRIPLGEPGFLTHVSKEKGNVFLDTVTGFIELPNPCN